MGKKRRQSAKYTELASSKVTLPSFDERALSTLTEKIESGFRNTAASNAGSFDRNEPPGKSHRDRIERPQNSKAPTKNRLAGRKRDAQGNVREQGGHDSRVPKIGTDGANGRAQDEQSILLQEIIALGGTHEDLSLVMGVASDEDDASDTGHKQISEIDPKLKKELSKFIAGLGIETQANEEASESESGGDEDIELEDLSDESIVKPKATNTVKQVKTSAAQDANGSTKRQKDLMFEARPDWHAALLPDLPGPDLSDFALPGEAITELKKHAISLLEIDNNLYSSKHLLSTSSHRFLSTIMSSGTLSDKVSALTLVIQESPVHTVKSFESLLALAKKRSRGQAVTALGAIKDLLGVGALLPSDRRLRTFESQPGLLGTLQARQIRNWKSGDALPGRITTAHMISWAYEDWLKETYFDVLKVLESWCNDEVVFARGRAVTYVYELLREKPEQESNLLRLLVNKLGDPDKKIASRISYLILQLQTTHPLMKSIIIQAIQTELLLRPGQSSHAKYYAINTLNQSILSAKEEEVARKLLSLYFDLFVTLLKKPDPQKIVAGPIVNRKGQIQGGGGHKGRKAKEKAKKRDLEKQLGEEMTEKMISAVLTGVNRAFPFAKSDDFTLEKHMNMLFRITHSSNFNTSVQALILIQQLAASKHLAEDRFYRTLYESLLDPRLITSSKHAMYLNLLFKALKSDLNAKRVKAFAKRLLQVITLHQPPFVCGVLYLLRELEGTFPSLSALFNSPEESDEMDEEIFLDVPEGGMEPGLPTESPPAGQVHLDRNFIAQKERNIYDGRKRDPEHSNAERSCLWEVLPFIAHFHPSVSLFASRLLQGKEMPTKPDLASHTLIHFLDRFVYRNAKVAASSLRGNSIMQPLAGGEGRGILVSNRLTHRHEPLNSESFWRKKIDDVAVDEVFFHKYFNHVGKAKKPSRQQVKSVEDGEDMGGGEDGDENEDEIWQALVESRPEVEGHSEEDSDLEMLDLEDSEDDSSPSAEADLEESEDDESAGLEDSDVGASHDVDGDVSSDDGEDSSLDMGELFRDEDPAGKVLEDGKSSRSKRKMLKNLPIFASTEEYADMLEDDENMD